MKRKGWTADSLIVGEKITVFGSPARREDNVCLLKTLTLEDGTEIARNGEFVRGGQATEAVEETAEQTERPLRLANGQPNLQGPWVTKSFGRNGEGSSARWAPTAAGMATRWWLTP